MQELKFKRGKLSQKILFSLLYVKQIGIKGLHLNELDLVIDDNRDNIIKRLSDLIKIGIVYKEGKEYVFNTDWYLDKEKSEKSNFKYDIYTKGGIIYKLTKFLKCTK